MSATPPCASLGHSAFEGTMRYFVKEGTTPNERELAKVCLEIYSLVPDHPAIINWLNSRTLQAMEETSDGLD